MKTCKHEGCGQNIDDKYEFCVNHYRTGYYKAPAATPSAKAWNDDPIVDALLKINSNCGKMAQSLERIERELRLKNGDTGEEDVL